MLLTVLKRIGQILYRKFLSFGFSAVSHDCPGVMGFGEADTEGEKLLVPSCQGSVLSTWLTTADADLGHWVRWCLSASFIEMLLFPPFQTTL